MADSDFDFSENISLSQYSEIQPQTTVSTRQTFITVSQANGQLAQSKDRSSDSIKNELDAMSLDSMMGVITEARELRNAVSQQKRHHAELASTKDNGFLFKSKVQDLENQMKQNESSQLTLREKLAESDRDKKRNSEQLNTLGEQCKRLNKENESLKNSMVRLEFERNDLRSQASHAQLQKEIMEKELNLVKAQLEKKDQENRDLIASLSEYQSAVENSKRVLNNLGLAEFTEQITKATASAQDLITVENSFNAEKNNIYEFLNILLGELQAKDKALREIQDSKIKEAVTALEAENFKLKQDANAQKVLEEQHVKKNSELLAQIFELQQRKELLQKTISDRNSEQKELLVLKDELKRKKGLLTELQALVKVLESNYAQIEESRSKSLEAETQTNEKKYEELLTQYNLLKEEWIRLMKEYNTLKGTLEGVSDKESQNIMDTLAKANHDLKEQNKKTQVEIKKIYEDAVTKINRMKKYIRELIGWELSISQEIIELKSVVIRTNDKDPTIVIRVNEEEGGYEILETDFSREIFEKNQNLSLLVTRSYPVLFSYINVLLRPDLSDLYYVP